ncbi:hypothetical protein [Dapis sp. BLCC M229]
MPGEKFCGSDLTYIALNYAQEVYGQKSQIISEMLEIEIPDDVYPSFTK